MGAGIILNSRYFRVAQPGQQENKNIFTKSHTANLVEYVGTRESVSFNSNTTVMEGNATDKQKNALEILMKECSDYKNTHEYIDYIENPTKANASELITRLSELLLLDKGILLDEGVSELVSYVGTRPSVDIEKSQQHGLFSSTENVDLDKAMEEISSHKGRIWTHVISLRREDADRLGYSSQVPWKQLVRSQVDTIAKANNIKFENLRWYAGMHNTGSHPHIHLFIYSTDPKEGYINAKGIKSIKSAFANEIFKDDLKHSFVSQTEYRNKIKEEMERLVDIINDNPLSQYDNDVLLNLQGRLINLAKAMPTTGKYFYKYQPQDIKKQVDGILHELIEKSADMTKLYNMWCNEQEKILGTYNKHPKYNTPIENNNSFKMLKNCLLKKARELQTDNNLYLHNTGNTIENTYSNEPLIENESVPVDERDTEISNEKHIEQFIADGLDVLINNLVEFEKENLLMPDFLTVNDKILDLEYNAEDNSDSAYNLGIKYLYGSTEDNIAKNYELAHRYLVMSANKNNAYANYQLGKMYYNGIGVEADIDISNNYFLKAHDLLLCQLSEETLDCITYGIPLENVDYDISKAIYTLGAMYYNGYGVMQNYEKAKLYFTGSKEKIPYSNIYLGNIELYGLGCDVNYNETKAHYENAQKSKNELTQAQASYKIAMIHEKGLGTNVDYRLAFQHYMISADMGFADAYYKMGQLLETEKFCTKDISKYEAYRCYESAFNLYIKAEKEMPNKTTELTIGTMYTKGQGVETNEDKAIEWLTKSAKNGNDIAYQKLGLIYANKDSKYFNIEKAIEYFEKSVDGGNSFANYQLAKIYLDKESGFYDLDKAISNLQISADQGNHFANYHLGKIYADSENQHYNLDKAISNLQTSADQGNHFANYHLGKIYANPESQYYNLDKAISNLQTSADQGNHFANYHLGKIYADPKSQYYNLDKAISNLQTSADQGNHFANYHLGKIYADDNNSYFNIQKAIYNLKLATTTSNGANAYYKLGKLYANKYYECFDIDKAKECFSISSDMGNIYAQQRLQSIENNNIDISNSNILTPNVGMCLSDICKATARMIMSDMNDKIINYNQIDSQAKKKTKKQKIQQGHNPNESNSNEFNLY